MSTRRPFVRMGEDGFTFSVSTGLMPDSISSAQLHFRKPDGTVTDKTCDDSDLTTGRYGWVVTEGFFDTAGYWEVSLTVDLGADGERKLKNPIPFSVGDDNE